MTELYQAALRVLKRIRDAGFEAYFAGGCVRDHLRGVPPKDYDIATSALPDQVEALFRRTVLVGKQFGVVRVREDGYEIEVATFRSDFSYSDGRHPDAVRFSSYREDVMRRDFTVNGLLYDPLENKVIDLVGGQEDLRRRVIRCIGDPNRRFEEDKLRVMRAIRFACQLQFEIDPPTFEAVRRFALQITRVSWERIRDELKLILLSDQRARGLRLMDESGLLPQILPEVAALKGVAQPPDFHPEGDVYTHTLLALEQLNQPSFEVALATLLHDVGKPKTVRVEAGRIRFPGHETEGATLAAEIGRRLRLSNDEIEKVCALVRDHLRLKDVRTMKASTLKRFLNEPHFEDLMAVCRADILASHKDLGSYQFALEARARFLAERSLRPEPLLRGRDLIAAGLTPSPRFTEILRRVEDLQLEGRLKSREEALEYVRKTWPELFARTNP